MMQWPKKRIVGRVGDMAPPSDTHIRVLLDADNDVGVSIWDNANNSGQWATIEFCSVIGGGRSTRTREALIALMVAMEADNAETPHKQWPPLQVPNVD